MSRGFPLTVTPPVSLFRTKSGQPGAQPTGRSVRMSGGLGGIPGRIVVILNGEGRGVPCRVVSQNKT